MIENSAYVFVKFVFSKLKYLMDDAEIGKLSLKSGGGSFYSQGDSLLNRKSWNSGTFAYMVNRCNRTVISNRINRINHKAE